MITPGNFFSNSSRFARRPCVGWPWSTRSTSITPMCPPPHVTPSPGSRTRFYMATTWPAWMTGGSREPRGVKLQVVVSPRCVTIEEVRCSIDVRCQVCTGIFFFFIPSLNHAFLSKVRRKQFFSPLLGLFRMTWWNHNSFMISSLKFFWKKYVFFLQFLHHTIPSIM